VSRLIETRNLFTDFHTFEGVVKALNGVALVIDKGETYGIVGESGCGKSVTVRSMMRIVQSPGRIVDGRILVFFDEGEASKGIDLLERSEAFMTSVRGDRISMIFQEASTSLNPVFTIADQVGESFFLHRRGQVLDETIAALDAEIARARLFTGRGWKLLQRSLFRRERAALQAHEREIDRIDAALLVLEGRETPQAAAERASLNARRDRVSVSSRRVSAARRVPLLALYYRRLERTVRGHVVDLLRSLGVANPERVAAGYPHELSGGMQQRIVIAIALACHPVLLIADEPTSNLDVTIQAQIVELIKTLKATTISSVLYITHDLGLVAEICDRTSVMYAGDVAETATVKDIFREPLHPYTQGLLRSVPKVEQAGELASIPGAVPNLVVPPTGCRFHPRCPHVMDICPKEKPPTVERGAGHFVACHLYSSRNARSGAPEGNARSGAPEGNARSGAPDGNT
jgi:peptide/nickel transport system ATP-binding protein